MSRSSAALMSRIWKHIPVQNTDVICLALSSLSIHWFITSASASRKNSHFCSSLSLEIKLQATWCNRSGMFLLMAPNKFCRTWTWPVRSHQAQMAKLNLKPDLLLLQWWTLEVSGNQFKFKLVLHQHEASTQRTTPPRIPQRCGHRSAGGETGLINIRRNSAIKGRRYYYLHNAAIIFLPSLSGLVITRLQQFNYSSVMTT